MTNECNTKLQELKEYITKIEYLYSAMSVLGWDMEVNIPEKGVSQRSEVLGYLSGEAYKLITSDKVKEYIEFFEKNNNSDMDDTTKAIIENMRKDYDETKKIPEDRYVKYSVLTSKTFPVWQQAKVNNDYKSFEPLLKEIVEFQKEFIGYWGYTGNKYNTLLDKYEPGITVEKLDKTFGELRDAIVTLLNKIKKSNVTIDNSFFKKSFTKQEQEEFSIFVMEKMGFDFAAGRVDESEHPFTTEFSNKDVRITTHYYENEWTSALFSCIHEGGHALYEQDIPDTLSGTGLAHGVSMGVHESQSRFYENIIGRSKEFWTYFYPEAKKRFPQFEEVSFDEFYRAINIVKPSLVRTEADELTYSLHVIIRYEIEKALINGEIEVKDLPKVWNAKYKEYLGIEPSTDTEGVLQDMHWSDGSFGYFPSYALGNLYGAQFLSKMEKDMPNMYEEIEKGHLDIIHNWLKENIHKYGSVYKPTDLIKRVTGEELNAKYFIEYLNKKYSEVYNLK